MGLRASRASRLRRNDCEALGLPLPARAHERVAEDKMRDMVVRLRLDFAQLIKSDDTNRAEDAMRAPSKSNRRLMTIRKFRVSHRPGSRQLWATVDSFLRHPATLLVLGFILT